MLDLENVIKFIADSSIMYNGTGHWTLDPLMDNEEDKGGNNKRLRRQSFYSVVVVDKDKINTYKLSHHTILTIVVVENSK